MNISVFLIALVVFAATAGAQNLAEVRDADEVEAGISGGLDHIGFIVEVCGIDGRTYGDENSAKNAGIPVECNSKCPCECTGPFSVCVSDPCKGKTCPRFPNAQCFVTGCNRCTTKFVHDGKIVDDCSLPLVPEIDNNIDVDDGRNG